MSTETVKGFKDYTGEEARKRAEIQKIVIENLDKYGFEPAETPVVEYEEFVKGDNEKDEAVSDIFKLKDKGERKLALRYEHTFQLKRIMKNKKLPYKRYQIGEVFRDEPVQGNRVRQFTSCDADIIGGTARDEAEVLSMIKDIMNELNIRYTIYVNNRKLMNEILDDLNVKEKKEVIREIDKLDKIPAQDVAKHLDRYNARNAIKIFKNNEKYFEKYSAYKEIEELRKYCKYYNVEFEFLPSLARGLSYYDGNVFEIKSTIKETILGGGAYTFNDIKAFGFGVSIERLYAVSNPEIGKERYLVISLNQDKEAISLAQHFRANGKSVSVFYGKPSKALEFANSYQYNKVVFVGEKEVKKGKYKVKDMKTGKESMMKG